MMNKKSNKKKQKTGKLKNILKSAVKPFRNLAAEFRSIRWCGLKDWVKSSLIVILFGSVIALCLAGFDYVSGLVVSLISMLGGVL